MSRSSKSSGALLTLTSLRNHGTSCEPTPYPAHSSDSLNNVVPSVLYIDRHKGTLNLVTSYLTKGGPLRTKSTSSSNPTPITLLPLLIYLPQPSLCHPLLPHAPSAPLVHLSPMTTHAIV